MLHYWQQIIHYCSYQERCHEEVRIKLIQLGANAAEADEHIINLISENFLNEERYAQAYARGHFYLKKWGRVKITQHLRSKKISDQCIAKGLQEIDPDDYRQCLSQLIERKMEIWSIEKRSPKNISRLYRYAVQKGYEFQLINEVIAQLLK